MLSLKSNRLESIPEGALSPRLTWLILTDNRLRRLPKDIGSLNGLRKLMLTGNLLEMLPDEIVQCRNLELVRLSDNRLEALPTGMLQMPKLAWLALAGNPMAPVSEPAHGANALPPGAPPRFAELRYEELTLGEELGRGAGGVVTKAVWNRGQETVVVKAFNASGVSDGRPENEQAAWASVPSPHPNTVACLCAFSAPKLGVIFEYLPGLVELGKPPNFETCTRDTFKAGTSFSPGDILIVAAGVAAAAAHLHENGFVHGDLYAHNTLVSPGYATVKLGDYGAVWALPAGMRIDVQRLEMRAFGCFLDDMLANMASTDQDEVVNAMRSLASACMQEDVNARPLMEEVQETVCMIRQCL
jgi:hypothetical protein